MHAPKKKFPMLYMHTTYMYMYRVLHVAHILPSTGMDIMYMYPYCCTAVPQHAGMQGKNTHLALERIQDDWCSSDFNVPCGTS